MDRDSQQASPFPNPLRWFPEFLEIGRRRMRSQVRLLGSAVLVGIVAGLGAIVFYIATQLIVHFALGVAAGYRPEPHPAGEPAIVRLGTPIQPFRPWMLLIVPALGGIVSGFLVFTFAPEAEGHGTDAVIAAYHHHQGHIRPRVPLVKIISSAITIGTGGSGGREGPIAQIGAGFGSTLAGVLRLRPSDRRVLMAAGMGAGVAAIFRAPLAGALFAAEVLYWSPEFEPEVIIPAALASVVSYCTFGAVFGWSPLFEIPNLTFQNPLQLGPYLLLALFMSVLAMLYTRTFYAITHVFHRLRMPRHFKPAIGAALSGLVGVALYFVLGRQEQVLAVLSFGYGALQHAMTQEQNASAWVLLAIALGKILTTGLTIGSGGSGGVFGPSMVIGGCGGGALGLLLHGVWPDLVPHPASYVVVGMAGFFAAAAKTPFSTLVIVSEMTGGYHLLLPALWVCVLAFMLSDEQSIYSSQVESRSRSPAHRGSFVSTVLSGVKIGQFVKIGSPVPVLRSDEPLAGVLERFSNSAYSVLPVADCDNRLLGVVNLEEVYIATQSPHLLPLVLASDLMRTDITPLTPEDQLDQAQELFVENDLLALPIVNDLADRKTIGIARRADIANAYVSYLHGRESPIALQARSALGPPDGIEL